MRSWNRKRRNRSVYQIVRKIPFFFFSKYRVRSFFAEHCSRSVDFKALLHCKSYCREYSPFFSLRQLSDCSPKTVTVRSCIHLREILSRATRDSFTLRRRRVALTSAHRRDKGIRTNAISYVRDLNISSMLLYFSHSIPFTCIRMQNRRTRLN